MSLITLEDRIYATAKFLAALLLLFITLLTNDIVIGLIVSFFSYPAIKALAKKIHAAGDKAAD